MPLRHAPAGNRHRGVVNSATGFEGKTSLPEEIEAKGRTSLVGRVGASLDPPPEDVRSSVGSAGTAETGNFRA